MLSMWAGLRPLVKPLGDAGGTKSISREHTVHVASSGLVTVTGGKWTTYRAMAEDVLRHCQLAQLLPAKLPPCATRQLPLLGHRSQTQAATAAGLGDVQGLATYGDEAAWVQALPGADVMLAPQSGLTEAMVRFAARHEYARTVEDVLARRSRLLFLHASAAHQASARVAQNPQRRVGPASLRCRVRAAVPAIPGPGLMRTARCLEATFAVLLVLRWDILTGRPS